jgi:hypothetical protein
MIVEKDRNLLIIEKVEQITSMEDVLMTCANMCGVQLEIVNISASKPIITNLCGS